MRLHLLTSWCVLNSETEENSKVGKKVYKPQDRDRWWCEKLDRVKREWIPCPNHIALMSVVKHSSKQVTTIMSNNQWSSWFTWWSRTRWTTRWMLQYTRVVSTIILAPIICLALNTGHTGLQTWQSPINQSNHGWTTFFRVLTTVGCSLPMIMLTIHYFITPSDPMRVDIKTKLSVPEWFWFLDSPLFCLSLSMD